MTPSTSIAEAAALYVVLDHLLQQFGSLWWIYSNHEVKAVKLSVAYLLWSNRMAEQQQQQRQGVSALLRRLNPAWGRCAFSWLESGGESSDQLHLKPYGCTVAASETQFPT